MALVLVEIRLVPPTATIKVVADSNSVEVTIWMPVINEPAGTAPKVPVRLTNVLAVTGIVWATTVAPVLRIEPAVVPVVFLTVPSSQGPR